MKSWEVFTNKTNKTEFEVELSKIFEDIAAEANTEVLSDCD
jgi:hypothetical protein